MPNGQRSDGRSRPTATCYWAAGAARCRRFDHAGCAECLHARTNDYDRREGRRHDSRGCMMIWAWHTPMRSAVMALRRLRRFARLDWGQTRGPTPSRRPSSGPVANHEASALSCTVWRLVSSDKGSPISDRRACGACALRATICATVIRLRGPTHAIFRKVSPLLAWQRGSSRDCYPTVDRQNLARDHARFVTSEIKRRVGDVAGFDQAEQMRVSKPGQSGVSGYQLFDPLGHGRRRRNSIDANPLWRIGDSQRTGDCGNPALCRRIAITAGDPHQRNIRAHVDHRTASGLDKFGDPEPATKECAVKVELYRPPEFIERRVDCRIVPRGRPAGVIMEHVEMAELVDGRADRCLQAVGVGHVGADRNRLVSSKVSGLLAGLAVDLGDCDLRTFAGEQNCGSAADAITGACDEGHPACKPWHRSLLLDRKVEIARGPAVRVDTLTAADAVASARHRAGAMP